MEYAQERVATLHAYGDVDPPAPVGAAAVVVPLVGDDHATPAATGVFTTLERLDPGRVVVALRADPGRVGDVVEWLEGFDLSLSVLWCNAPAVEGALAAAGLGESGGKGRDVWLALGVASTAEYVVVHDADATNYDRTDVSRLLSPLASGFEFVKGYYARVENDRLYGRLCRLFVAPLLRALEAGHDADVLSYLGAFRYALAGEMAMTGDMARRLRAPRGWGFEVGALGDAFAAAGFDGTAQVDLGVHEHDHRPVSGPGGLGTMAREVGATLLTVAEEHGVTPDYDALPGRYRETARELVDQYAADAAFNELRYDAAAERAQVDQYADAIAPPGADDRLPAWRDTSLDPDLVARRSAAALDGLHPATRQGRVEGDNA